MLTVENKIKYVLWTGGWDSTFLFLKLIHDDEVQTIQPIYVAGDGRGSELKEIQTMNDLLPRLRAINSTEIKDLIIINKGDIPENSRITEAYDHIRGIVKIGTQYEWLARLSEQYPGIAIGIEKPSGEYSGCVAAIEKTGRMVNGGGGTTMLIKAIPMMTVIRSSAISAFPFMKSMKEPCLNRYA